MWRLGIVVATTLVASQAGGTAAAPEPVPGWGPVRTVSPQRFLGTRSHDVQARMSGSLVVAWVHKADGAFAVHVRERRATGSWRTPRVVSDPLTGRHARLDVAVGRGRVASLVWTDELEGERVVVEAHHTPGGWSDPQVLGRGTGPRVVVDGHGNTTVAWRSHGVVVTRRPAVGTWGTPHRLAGRASWGLDLAGNSAGDLVATWVSAGRIRAVTKPRGRGWRPVSTRMRIGELPAYSSLGPPRARMDSSGAALVVWSTIELDRRTELYRSGVVWSRSHGKRWSGSSYLCHDLGEAGALLDVAMNGRGQGLVAWRANRGGGDDVQGWLEVRRLRTDGSWGPRAVLTPRRSIEPGRAWVDRFGGAHVVVDVYGAAGSGLTAFRQPRGRAWDGGVRIGRGSGLDASGAGHRWTVIWIARHLESRTLDVTR